MAEHQSRHQDRQEPFNHDVHLIKEIKDALMRQTESAGIDIRVSAEDGAVRLYGVVDVLSHKQAAEEIARRIPGVYHIDNDLTVANEETFPDKDIHEAVTNKLADKAELRGIGCRVHKGVVLLVGHAGSNDDVQAAVRLAQDTIGVRDVRVERVKIGEGQREDEADVARAAEACLERLGYDQAFFQVYSDAGVLFVKGFVPTREDRSRLKSQLHRIPGVDRLEALLVTDDQLGGEIH